jgi:hypothetical protein
VVGWTPARVCDAGIAEEEFGGIGNLAMVTRRPIGVSAECGGSGKSRHFGLSPITLECKALTRCGAISTARVLTRPVMPAWVRAPAVGGAR